MEESKKLPEFESTDALVEFLENNDTTEYFDSMPEVQFDLSRGRAGYKRRKNLVAIDDAVMQKVRKRASAEHTSAQALINAWLEEKVASPA